MKRRRLPPSPHLKRLYNLCHRLRLQGVRVDTVGNAINIATDAEYNALSELARKYIQALKTEYRYVIQTYIPDGESGSTVVLPDAVAPAPPLKFLRTCRHPKKHRLYDDFGFEKCSKCQALL